MKFFFPMTATMAAMMTAMIGVPLSPGPFVRAHAEENVKKREYVLPVPETETLPNGMHVVWFVNDHLPVVDLAMMVNVGFRDDPSGKSGVSELLSSTLSRGAAGLTAQQVAHSIESLGASHYETANEDSFTVGIHGLSPDADTLLEILGKIVTQPSLSDTEINREKARIIEKWQHIGDYSGAMASIAYRRILAVDSPYGRGSLLNLKEFKKLEASDVRSFYKHHFTASNSLLLVVGRIDKKQFRQKILSLFGGWKGETPAREKQAYRDLRFVLKGKNTDLSSTKVLVLDRPGTNQAQVRIGFRAPSILVPEHHALVVANALLGEYFHSRLNTLLRDQLGLTYGVNSTFSYSKDLSEFTIGSSTRSESVGELIVKAIEVLKQLKSGPIGADEVIAAKEYLIGSFPLSTSTLQAVASRWLAGRILGVQPEYLSEYMSRVQKVSPEEVKQAVQKYFTLDKLIVVVAGDAKKINESLQFVKLPAMKQMSISDLN